MAPSNVGGSVLGQLPEGTPAVLRLTVDQVHRMLAAGILSDTEPVELIDGLLVRKARGPEGDPMVISSAHALAVTLLGRLDRLVEPHGFHVRVQQPVTLSEVSEPEPDVAIVRGMPESFSTRHPGPEDLVAVVEVAESSLAYDRTAKQRLYASAGIDQYWVLNLVDRQVEVHSEPIVDRREYGRVAVARPGETISLVLGPAAKVELAAGALLPQDA